MTISPVRNPALVWLVALALTVTASADTLHVDRHDPGCDDAIGTPYCTIQAAIDDAGPGDVIRVHEGVYLEHLVVDVPDVKLKSDDDDEPAIIDASEGSNSNGVAITIVADGVIVKDLVIRYAEIGIAAHGVHGVTIEDNEIHGHAVCAVAISGTSHEIEDNDVFDNADGIRLGHPDEESTGCTIADNDVFGHAGLAIGLDHAHGNLVEENDLDDNAAGIRLTGGSTSNEIVDNSVKTGSGVGIEAAGGGGNAFRENNVRFYGANGILILTDGNHLVENKGRQCGRHGIRINGDFNTIEACKAKDNEKHGFYVDGNDNVLAENDADRNILNGFRISGSRNELIDNDAEENQRHGYRVCNGAAENLLMGNEADENDNYGFSIHPAATDTELIDNECEDNNQGSSNPGGLCSVG